MDKGPYRVPEPLVKSPHEPFLAELLIALDQEECTYTLPFPYSSRDIIEDLFVEVKQTYHKKIIPLILTEDYFRLGTSLFNIINLISVSLEEEPETKLAARALRNRVLQPLTINEGLTRDWLTISLDPKGNIESEVLIIEAKRARAYLQTRKLLIKYLRDLPARILIAME